VEAPGASKIAMFAALTGSMPLSEHNNIGTPTEDVSYAYYLHFTDLQRVTSPFDDRVGLMNSNPFSLIIQDASIWCREILPNFCLFLPLVLLSHSVRRFTGDMLVSS
jgi:hypothetical protein